MDFKLPEEEDGFLHYLKKNKVDFTYERVRGCKIQYLMPTDEYSETHGFSALISRVGHADVTINRGDTVSVSQDFKEIKVV